jgi:hypothetical protein
MEFHLHVGGVSVNTGSQAKATRQTEAACKVRPCVIEAQTTLYSVKILEFVSKECLDHEEEEDISNDDAIVEGLNELALNEFALNEFALNEFALNELALSEFALNERMDQNSFESLN